MTPLSQLKAVEYGLESTVPVSVSQTASGMRSLFVGPRGLRAGWRLLSFLGLLAVLFGGIALVRTGAPQGLREAQKHLSNGTVTPFKKREILNNFPHFHFGLSGESARFDVKITLDTYQNEAVPGPRSSLVMFSARLRLPE